MASAERREREKQQLREKILKTARQIIREEGYEALTIRKIADRIEYAPMSLYNHFADKTAILLALARSVFSHLEEVLPKPGRDPIITLRKGLLAYIEFGLNHPDEYQLIFMTRLPAWEHGQTPSKDKNAPDHTGGRHAFQRLEGYVQACITAGKIQEDAFQVATTLWAGVHGMVSLQITQTDFPFGPRKVVAEALVDTLLRGVQTD